MSRFILILAAVISITMGCRKDRFGSLQTETVTVRVLYPETYSQANATGAEVTITSVMDGNFKTGTVNSDGLVVFQNVLAGTYNIAASRTLTAAEAQTQTGIAGEIRLNALRSNVEIISGSNPSFELRLQGGTIGGLVIKEVYYTGSRTPAGGTYFSDQFVEIYNNSTDTLYLDSLCIADIYGNSGQINPTSIPTPFNTDANNSYANNIWRIPGTGKSRPLAPGKSIVIAQDGVNHQDPTLNPASPVDLSKADWETYNERPDNRDADAPDVPNLNRVYFTGGFDWLLTVFGPGVIIFKADFESLEQTPVPGLPATFAPRIKIPNALVIDAFEALRDANSATYKRIPAGLDAGFVFADDTYNKQSFRRKTANTINGRRVLQDTNNSSQDFEKLASPTPKSFN